MPVSSQHFAVLDDDLPEDAELAGAVRDAAQSLPPRLRVVLYLTDVEGLSYGQAAKVMGTSAGTVAGEVRRARDRLRDRLDPAIRQAFGSWRRSSHTAQDGRSRKLG